MKTRIKTHNKAGYELVTETINEVEHIIVPVVMMLEGVHHGSAGAILHTEAEISKEIEQWNGIPVTLHHPQDKQGNYISANTKGVKHIGVLRNTKFEDGKLKAEAVLNTMTMVAISPECVESIRKKEPLDVSIGVFSQDIEEAGEWNGEQYEAIATNYRADHLALLPGDIGACSWNDGCGIRANKRKDIQMTTETMKQLVVNGLTVNKQSFGDISSKLWNLIYSKGAKNDKVSYYTSEVYDGYVIYEKNEYSEDLPTFRKYYKQSYQINADDSIELVGEPQEVKKTVEYEPINVQTNKGEQKMKQQKIETLIANEQTRFDENDKEWLQTLSECALDKLEPKMVANRKKEEIEKAEVTDKDVQAYVSKLEEKDLVALLPKELQLTLNEAKEAKETKRKETIEAIQANSKEWTAEELTAMDCGLLEKLHKTVVPAGEQPADYSAAGGGMQANKGEQDDEMLLPPDTYAEENK